MISLKYLDIPNFLYESAFYLSLNEGTGDSGDEVIQIPSQCYKEDDKVDNLDDFGQLLRTMQFWGIDVIPDGMIGFLCGSATFYWKPVAYDVLGPNSSLLDDLIRIYEPCGYQKYQPVLIEPVQVEMAIRRNRCELLTYWLENGLYKENSEKYSHSETDIAASCGNIDGLKIFHRHHYKVTVNTAVLASYLGHFECLLFLRDINCPWSSTVLANAALAGRLNILEYGYEQGWDWDGEVCAAAASNGHLDCLRFAHEHGCPWSGKGMEYAAYNNHYDCLKYALEHGYEVNSETMVSAVHKGNLRCLQLLHQFNVPWDDRTTATAAQFNQIHILQYLHEHNCPWTADVYYHATTNGHIDCIRYAHSQGLDISTVEYNLCSLAAQCNYIEILKYFHENGAEWNEWTVLAGVRSNSLDIVQYAITQGCEWNRQNCIKEAIKMRSADLICYLLTQGKPSQAELHAYALTAVQVHYDGVLQYLVEEFHYDLRDENNDNDCSSVFSAALAAGNLGCVKYCFARGCQRVQQKVLCSVFDSVEYLSSSDMTLLQCVQYLVKQGWEVPDPFMQFVEKFKVKLSACEAYCRANKLPA